MRLDGLTAQRGWGPPPSREPQPLLSPILREAFRCMDAGVWDAARACAHLLLVRRSPPVPRGLVPAAPRPPMHVCCDLWEFPKCSRLYPHSLQGSTKKPLGFILNPKTLGRLIHCAAPGSPPPQVALLPGELLFEDGSPCTHLYLIVSGDVELAPRGACAAAA
eukprot:37034-Chlamydomonas_euryale.AAC.1